MSKLYISVDKVINTVLSHTHTYISTSRAVVCSEAVDSAVRGSLLQPGTESGESGQAEKALGVP